MSLPQNRMQWYDVLHLIENLSTSSAVKHLLITAYSHTNHRKHVAWVSQGRLTEAMGLSLATIKRAFHDAQKLGVLSVHRVRTGKGQRDQHNEYWIILDKIIELTKRQSDACSDGSTAHTELCSDVTTAHNELCSETTTAQSRSEHSSNRGVTTAQCELRGYQVMQDIKVKQDIKKPGEREREKEEHQNRFLSPHELKDLLYIGFNHSWDHEMMMAMLLENFQIDHQSKIRRSMASKIGRIFRTGSG